MQQIVRGFTSLCHHCGPVTFHYYHGREEDGDPVWCTGCGKTMTFMEFEEGLFEGVTDKDSIDDPVAEPDQDDPTDAQDSGASRTAPVHFPASVF